MNKKDSKKRPDKATATIRSVFEKTTSKIEEEIENSKSKISSSLFQKLKKKFSFSSNLSKTADVPAFTSQFHHEEKYSRFDSDVIFNGENSVSSTPLAHITRTRASRGYVDLSKVKTNRTYALRVKKEETSEGEEK